MRICSTTHQIITGPSAGLSSWPRGSGHWARARREGAGGGNRHGALGAPSTSASRTQVTVAVFHGLGRQVAHPHSHSIYNLGFLLLVAMASDLLAIASNLLDSCYTENTEADQCGCSQSSLDPSPTQATPELALTEAHTFK